MGFAGARMHLVVESYKTFDKQWFDSYFHKKTQYMEYSNYEYGHEARCN